MSLPDEWQATPDTGEADELPAWLADPRTPPEPKWWPTQTDTLDTQG